MAWASQQVPSLADPLCLCATGLAQLYSPVSAINNAIKTVLMAPCRHRAAAKHPPEQLLKDPIVQSGPRSFEGLPLCACTPQLSTWLLQVDAGKADTNTPSRHDAKRNATEVLSQPPPMPDAHLDSELPNPTITKSHPLPAKHVAISTSGLDNTGAAPKPGCDEVGGPGPLQHSSASHRVAMRGSM